MNSYIEIQHFTPKTEYKPLTALIPLIEQTLRNQNVESILADDHLL